MKITKRQLRRIIKEEKDKVLAEQKVRRIVRRRLMEQMDKKGHVNVVKGSYYLDGNNVAMTDDDVAKQFGADPVQLTDGAPWDPEDEAQLQSLNTLRDAGYHTLSAPGRSTRPIDDEIAMLERFLDVAVKRGGATWPKASALLSKLSRDPNDSATLAKLEDMVRKSRPGFERDEALDALYNIEAADSAAEKESAVDYATDYVRDAFRA